VAAPAVVAEFQINALMTFVRKQAFKITRVASKHVECFHTVGAYYGAHHLMIAMIKFDYHLA
jgi:hypothetical protein